MCTDHGLFHPLQTTPWSVKALLQQPEHKELAQTKTDWWNAFRSFTSCVYLNTPQRLQWPPAGGQHACSRHSVVAWEKITQQAKKYCAKANKTNCFHATVNLIKHMLEYKLTCLINGTVKFCFVFRWRRQPAVFCLQKKKREGRQKMRTNFTDEVKSLIHRTEQSLRRFSLTDAKMDCWRKADQRRRCKKLQATVTTVTQWQSDYVRRPNYQLAVSGHWNLMS